MQNATFDAMDYAWEKWGETLNYMSNEEINQLYFCINEEEVDNYLRPFYERT
jgi:hypothetical protein